jgi:hypothetical protein
MSEQQLTSNQSNVLIVPLKIFKQFLKQNAKVALYKSNEKFYGLLKQNLFNDVDFFCNHIQEITNNFYFTESENLYQNNTCQNQSSINWNETLLNATDFRNELKIAFHQSISEILS